ncbi:MAG: hypothetical protein ACRCYU_01945, partial [Nocardioides sp.]
AGGTQLTPHEIRVALFAGPLMASIETLNQDVEWRDLFGAKSKRVRDHELIMRILALYSDGSSYSRPLKTFLNIFAKKNRGVDIAADPRGQHFKQAVSSLRKQVGPGAFRRPGGAQVNTAQAEAICVALMNASTAGAMPSDLSARVKTLLGNEEFLKHTGRATADNEAVEARLRLAQATIA